MFKGCSDQGHTPPSTLTSFFEVIGFFDGASQGRGALCGAGGFIRLGNMPSFSLRMGGGGGSNNRGGILGLWTVLVFARSRHLDVLEIFGDSKVIIDWANGKGNLHATVLEGWKSRTRNLILSIQQDLDHSHLYGA